jgi:lysophospholipid acyltransferase (LPLAT)-like uncharacterized protein
LRPLRSPLVITILSSIFAGYSKLVFHTLRMTREGQEHAEAVWAQGRETGSGAILCFWHARIPMSPLTWPQDPGRQDMRALISRSADGEFIARVEKLGFPAIRGSSTKKTDPAKNKHGEQAFRDMIKWVKDGGGIAITPDGPRGPAEGHAVPGPGDRRAGDLRGPGRQALHPTGLVGPHRDPPALRQA